jgi:hypothetical protein
VRGANVRQMPIMENFMGKLEGTIALITGGNSGMALRRRSGL